MHVTVVWWDLTPATERRIYDLEASIEGRYADEALARLGLAFTADRFSADQFTADR
jgi:hypothetical protein